MGGAAEHLIDGSDKRICLLRFEFYSSHVIERRRNTLRLLANAAISTSRNNKSVKTADLTNEKVDITTFA